MTLKAPTSICVILNYTPVRSICALLVTPHNVDEREVFESEDEQNIAFVSRHGDGLPIVEEVRIVSDSKFTLIEDWLEEAIAAALGEQYDDNYYKANQFSKGG